MSISTYSYDNKSLMKDGKRWFPVMGEIHYSRYPQQYWKEALLKMKAGGVDIVSSYVIWIHHEEIENQWDFTGSRDLRKFVETIKECGMTMILRIGPWSHAEVRNGGFPDWLLAKCPKYRTNDEAYFAEVEKFYQKTFEQVKGLLLKDDGPIIGVQIENELGHCGGPYGEEGTVHMKRLVKMAEESGFDVPVYTATGWGGAVTAGLLPVMGGYCEAPWDPRITEIEPSGNYVFTYERNDHAIGCDFGLGEGITFDMDKVPYLTAELGGGLQVTYKRRPVAMPRDISGMSIAKIGSGCNLLGYYMYHGGQNPEGKLSTLEESTATGSLNDLPVKNYDFRAPLGEYGQPNGTFREIRRLALFVHDYGEELCSMDTFIPEENPVKPENLKDLRYSWRYDPKTEKGYLFVNNYQRRNKMADHTKVSLAVPEKVTGTNENGKITFSAADGDFFYIPFAKNQKEYSREMPLCKISSAGKTVSAVYPLTDADDKATKVSGDKILLSRNDSLNAQKVNAAEGEALVVTEGLVFENGKKGSYILESRGLPSYKVYGSTKAQKDFEKKDTSEGFAEYTYTGNLPPVPEVKVEKTSETEDKVTYSITVEAWNSSCVRDDVFVKIDYTGNCARLYRDSILLDDNIYIGPDFSWEIGLKRYGCEKQHFTLEIDALKKNQQIFLEKWPELKDEKTALLNGVKAENSYKVSIDL